MATTLRNGRSRTITTPSAKFTDALKPGQQYRLIGDVDFWFVFEPEGGSCTASENGAVLVAAGESVLVSPPEGSGMYLHVLRAAGVDGNANLAEVTEV